MGRDDGDGIDHAGSGDPRGDGASPRMWRRLVATSAFDSRTQGPLAGVRAAKAGFPRLIYEAAGYEIDLQVRLGPTAGHLRVLGQVLDGEFEPCSGWVVLDGARGLVKIGLDECGHFSIDGVAAGRHRLEVRLPDATIEIPSLYL
jgi:hypothetical protein